MDPMSQMRDELTTNLKLLSQMTDCLKKESIEVIHKIELKPEVFDKWTAHVFQVVTYFLFSIINFEECKKQFGACFPALDKKQESDFRKRCLSWLQDIKQKESDCHLPRMAAFYLQSLSGEGFLHLYLEFSNYVMKKVIQKMNVSETLELDSMDWNDSHLTQKLTKLQFNEYQNLKIEIEVETNHWIKQMTYFLETNKKLSQMIEVWKLKKLHFSESIESKPFWSQINSVEEMEPKLKLYLNELQKNVQILRKSLVSVNNEVNKKWIFYLNSFESEIRCSDNNTLDLNHCINSFDYMIEELTSRIQTYDMIAQNMQKQDLNILSERWTQLVIEANNYRNQLLAMTSKFESMLYQLKNWFHQKKSKLLKIADIIERREWLEHHFPVDLTQLNSDFTPKIRDLKVNESLTFVGHKPESESCIENVPKLALRPSLDYSFQIMEMSSCNYIPPNGQLHDSPLFSPVERILKKDLCLE